VIELLLARGEDEVRTAVDALEYPILKFGHGTILDGEGEAVAILFACWFDLLSGAGPAVAKSLTPAVREGNLFDFPPTLFPVTLPGKSGFDPLFFARLQIERMPLDLFNDVFLLHFPLEASKGIFQCFALLKPYFCQMNTPPNRFVFYLSVPRPPKSDEPGKY